MGSVPSVDVPDDDDGSERFAFDAHTEKLTLRLASTPAAHVNHETTRRQREALARGREKRRGCACDA